MPAPPPAGSQACYVPTHIGDARLDTLPLDATCHVLGASLSAYDVVNRLFGPATGCRFTRAADGRLRFEPGPNQRRVRHEISPLIAARRRQQTSIQGDVVRRVIPVLEMRAAGVAEDRHRILPDPPVVVLHLLQEAFVTVG